MVNALNLLTFNLPEGLQLQEQRAAPQHDANCRCLAAKLAAAQWQTQ